jgi:hypothetical protein
MKAKLFTELTEVLGMYQAPGMGGPGSPVRRLARVILDETTDAQRKTLVDTLPGLYKKRGKTITLAKPVAAVTETGCQCATPPVQATAGVKPDVQVINKLTATIGAYGHEAAATEEARQYKHPDVFRYRSGLFPNPQTYGVQVAVTNSEPVKLAEPGNPLNPWSVELTMEITGLASKTDAWADRFRTQAATQLTGEAGSTLDTARDTVAKT